MERAATTVYTLVCTACHSGWQSDTDTAVCPRCRRPAECRGVVMVAPIEDD